MVIIGINDTSRPPPTISPISLMPLNSVSPIAKNAMDVVRHPVKIPLPVCPSA